MDVQSAILEGGAIDAIASQLGVSPQTARSGAAALLPAILGGFKRQAQQRPDGLEGLVGGLEQLGGGALAGEVVAPGPTDPAAGNNILGSIFGSKEVSRNVAAQVGGQTGLEPSLLKRMLPLVAMLAAGQLASRGGGAGGAAQGGSLGGLLGGLIDRLGGGGATAQGGGLGGIGAMLDLDGDGNPLDDILGQVTGAMSRPANPVR